MNAVAKRKILSVEEFLDWEGRQPERYELIDGEIVAMVGGTLEHNRIAANLDRKLAAHLRGSGCTVFREGVKVRTATDVFYPDIVVTCTGAPGNAILVPEPVIVIEVLSPSTERRDRFTKNRAYRTLDSLRQYVLVAQDGLSLDSFVRSEAGWLHEPVGGLDGVLRLPPLDADLPLTTIYEDTDTLAEALRQAEEAAEEAAG